MLCKTILKLFYYAIGSRIDLKIRKPRLRSILYMILKRLDENCSKCNFKLLYNITLFQNVKTLSSIYATNKPSTKRNSYKNGRAPHNFKTIE